MAHTVLGPFVGMASIVVKNATGIDQAAMKLHKDGVDVGALNARAEPFHATFEAAAGETVTFRWRSWKLTTGATNTYADALFAIIKGDSSASADIVASVAPDGFPGGERTGTFSHTFAEAGSYKLYLRMSSTAPAAAKVFYNTDATESTHAPSTGDVPTIAKGVWRVGITVSNFVSGTVTLGGTQQTLGLRDTVKTRFTTDAVTHSQDAARAIAYAVTFSGGSTAIADVNVTQANKNASTTWDDATGRALTKVFGATGDLYGIRVTFPVLTWSGVPWTHLVSTPTVPTKTVIVTPGTTYQTGTNPQVVASPHQFAVTTYPLDVKVYFDHLFQIEDNAFGTPPSSKLTTYPPQRLTSERAFIGTRAKNVRGVGLNGVVLDTSLQDRSPAPENAQRLDDRTTATVNGEDGWITDFHIWSSQLPGGPWRKTVTIDATLSPNESGLEFGNTVDYSLLAPNPSIAIVTSGGPVNRAVHSKPGEPFQAGLVAVNVATGHRVSVDYDGTSPWLPQAYVAILRLADASLGADAGYGQFLDASNNWVTLGTATTAIYFHRLAESRPPIRNVSGTITTPGSRVFIKTWDGTVTNTWGEFDIFVVGKAVIGGAPYGRADKEAVVGIHASHDAAVSLATHSHSDVPAHDHPDLVVPPALIGVVS